MSRKRLKRAGRTFVAVVLCVASYSWAGDYTIVSEQRLELDKTYPHPYSLARGANGGYFVAGGTGPRAFAIKTNPELKTVWKTYLKWEYVVNVANTVIPMADGGAILAGHTFVSDGKGGVLDVPFATKLDREGGVIWTRKYGVKSGITGNGRFACGVETHDGIFVVGMRYKLWSGQPTNTGTALGTELRLTKLGEQGNVVWEKGIAEEGDDVVTALQLRQDNCARPIEDEAGDLVFAVSTMTGGSIVRNGMRIVAGPEVPDRVQRVVLAFKFDRDGRELARLKLSAGANPQLFARRGGYVLLDNILKKGARGVRATVLDRNLKLTSQHAAETEGPYFFMEAALADGHGGFHIAGYYTTPPAGRGRSAMAYLNERGELLDITQFGLGLPSWEPVSLAAHNDDVVLLRRDRRAVIELAILKRTH